MTPPGEAPRTPTARIEQKLDDLIEVVQEERTERRLSEQRLQTLTAALAEEKAARQAADLDERTAREKATERIEARMSKLAWMALGAALTLATSGLGAFLFKG